MSRRTYLSIGEVLALLRDEFPDVTISKIRFLESQGLVNPERTPSGYRKFYDDDVARLRWVLRQQREHFLPLKVIKGRLESGDAEIAPPPVGAVGLGGQDRAVGLGGQDRAVGLGGQDRAVGLGGQDRAVGLGGEERAVDGFGADGHWDTGAGVPTSAAGGWSSAEGGAGGGVGAPGDGTGVGGPWRPTASDPQEPDAQDVDGHTDDGHLDGDLAGDTDGRHLDTGRPVAGVAPTTRRGNGRRLAASAHAHTGAHPAAGATAGAPGPWPDGDIAGSAANGHTDAPGGPVGDRVGDGAPGGYPGVAAGRRAATGGGPHPAAWGRIAPLPGFEQPTDGDVADHPSAGGAAVGGPRRRRAVPVESPAAGRAPQAVPPTAPAMTGPAPLGAAGRPPAAPTGDPAPASGIGWTVAEVVSATGVDEEQLAELVAYGLVHGRTVAGTQYFDDEDVTVAHLAAAFARYGVEARHLRLHKHAAEREAGFVEQIVLPLLKQRNPEAHQRAMATAAELADLGQALRASVLRRALADLVR